MGYLHGFKVPYHLMFINHKRRKNFKSNSTVEKPADTILVSDRGDYITLNGANENHGSPHRV